MLEIVRTTRYDGAIKSYYKKHYDFALLNDVISFLINGIELPAKFRNHKLKGNLKGFQECHLEKDVLLLYKIENSVLILIDFGNHGDVLRR
ncbi:addiction module toxin, RelE/StbE family [Bacilli bacterium]|nr:addiction module toxin, RelE/StbE family [Bacilli bacterium]